MHRLQAELGPGGRRAAFLQPFRQGQRFVPVVGDDAAAVPVARGVGGDPDYRRLHHFRLDERGGGRALRRQHHIGGSGAARRQHIGGYAGAFQVLRHNGDQRLMAGFGRAVGRAALAPHRVHTGGNADDAAKTLLPHMAGNGVGHQKRAGEIDGDDTLPGVRRNIPIVGAAAGGAAAKPGGARVDAGVVHQDMQPAHFADGAGDSVLRRLRVGNVGDDGQHGVIAADFPQVVGGLVQPFLVDVQHRHAGAGPHQAGSDGTPHPDGAGRAGYDGHPALQGIRCHSHTAHLVCCIEIAEIRRR